MNLNPIDCSLEFLNSFSSNESFNFWPDYLTFAIPELRHPQVQMFYKFFSHMAKVSNDNSIRNADHLLTINTNINTTNMQWLVLLNRDMICQKLN